MPRLHRRGRRAARRAWRRGRSEEADRAGRRARSGSSPASRRFSVSSSSTAAPRSTGRTATSSSGCMPCASIVFASWTSAAPCLNPSIIRGFWRSTERRTGSVADELDDDELLAQLGVEAAAPADITELRHVRSAAEKRAAEEIANRAEVRGFRPLQAAVRAGAEGTRRGPAADAAVRAQVRDRAGPVLYPGRPKSLCRGDGENRSPTSTARWMPAFA